MPAFLRSALHILFSEDSSKLFVASNQGSLHIIRLLEGSFKHLHTFQPQSGEKVVKGELSVCDVSFFSCLNLHCWGFTDALHPADTPHFLTCLRFKVGGDTWEMSLMRSAVFLTPTLFSLGFCFLIWGPEKFHHPSWSFVSRARRTLKSSIILTPRNNHHYYFFISLVGTCI